MAERRMGFLEHSDLRSIENGNYILDIFAINDRTKGGKGKLDNSEKKSYIIFLSVSMV